MRRNMKSQNKKNIAMVISSNILTIVIALFSGFILPKELSIADYAYYKVYLLYIAYAGFFHFGFVNGIYLKYGDYNLEQLPEKIFRTYSMIMGIMQAAVVLILSVLLFACSSSMDSNKVIAFAFVIINIPLTNIKWFYSSINQFTKRFVIDSYVTYLQNIFNLLLVILVVGFRWYDFRYILVIITINNLVCMIITMLQNKSLICGKKERVNNVCFRELIRGGFFLMLSEFVGIIILGIDSIFVENLFSQTEFAMYSFAVSIITVIYTLISVVSNLIYPYLVRVSKEKYTEYYSLMSDILAIVSVASMLAFFAAKFIVLRWIDKYEASITIFSILFGTVIFRAIIMLVCGNYFKVLKMIRQYTVNNVFTIVMSFVLNVAAYVIFHDYRYIAVASLLSFIIWYLVTDAIFIRRLQVPKRNYLRRYLYIAGCLAIFYGMEGMEPVRAFFLYFVIICVLSLLCYYKQIRKVLRVIK